MKCSERISTNAPAGSRNPVLLIHGIDDTAAVFRQMDASLREHGWSVHCLNLVPNNGNTGLDKLAEQLASYVESKFAPGESIDLVGFSMGGLVSRYYVQRLGGIERVKRFITIASPHSGTWTAFLRGNPGSRQMRPASSFLADLNSDLPLLNYIRFTSIWTPLDLMILPAKSSVLTVGRSIKMKVPAHQLMVSDERVLRLVFRTLREDDVERPTGLIPLDRTQRRSREIAH